MSNSQSNLTIRQRLKYSPLGPLLAFPYRLRIVYSELGRLVRKTASWLINSYEWTNFTYDYTLLGKENAIAVASLLSGQPLEYVRRFAEELSNDQSISQTYKRQRDVMGLRYVCDREPKLGRQFFHYVMVRCTKPRIVMEAGTDKGLGALVMSTALKRNAAEGNPGRLITVDCQDDRGQLIGPEFAEITTLLVGDSVKILEDFPEHIDYFVHETTNEAKHCEMQFRALESKLAKDGIVVSAWFNDAFIEFCARKEIPCFIFAEEAANHWVRGSHLGVATTRLRPLVRT